MIRQYLIIKCDLAISRYNFVNKTAAAVGFFRITVSSIFGMQYMSMGNVINNILCYLPFNI